MRKGVTGAQLWATVWPVVGACLLLAPGCDCGGAGLQSGRPVISVQVTGLDFGQVPEATREVRGIEIDNPGLQALDITATIQEGSADFAVIDPQISIPPGQMAVLEVAFTPSDEGEDDGILLLASNDPLEPELTVDLHGGPIVARLVVTPDPVIAAGGQPLETLTVELRNDGRAHLHLRSVGVDPTGNPDFSVRATGLPVELPYRQSLSVSVDYARSTNPDYGRMILLSNDVDGEQRVVQLMPAAVALCADGVDNDLDGLTDYPDDPGCLDANDDDEEDPPECVDAATAPCGDDTGACQAGLRTCAAGQWGLCEGAIGPGVETCNGEDDNCDGTTDEGLTVACGAGTCAGSSTCVVDSGVAGGEWGPCEVPGAAPELCNGIDDDCDGQTDENVTQACTLNGCVGTDACLTDGSGQWGGCQADNAAAEICNGLDDNCDGGTDEGLVPPVCTTNGCAGTRSCTGAGGWSSCTPDFVDPETCDGIDNDCDGSTDEDVAPRACTTAAGCIGTQACPLNGNGQWGACQPDSSAPEACNGIDDNCDGQTDEAFPSLGMSCDVGVGECLRSGIVICDASATTTDCSAIAGPTTPEVCNGLDDDCNVQVDNGLGPVPSANQYGACAGNQDLCQGTAGYLPDSGNYVSTGESCNGIDDDCDNVVDDGMTPVPLANQNGLCAGNQEVCNGSAGYQDDPSNWTPITEVCNGLDDDCDGVDDNGLDPRPTANQAGECAGNLEFCNGTSGYQDDPTNHDPTTAEVCNGLDDNCDGSTDEGVCGACDPDGTYTVISGGPIQYTCVALGIFTVIDVNISSFTLSNDGATINSSTTNPNGVGLIQSLGGAGATCPSGDFVNNTILTGTCQETYTLDATFTDANTWTGTYTLNLSGSCFSCTNQSWTITAQRP